jgi:hypothetical protein
LDTTFLHKILNFFVNMCFSTTFQTYKFLQDSNPLRYYSVRKPHFFGPMGSFRQPKHFLLFNFSGLGSIPLTFNKVLKHIINFKKF